MRLAAKRSAQPVNSEGQRARDEPALNRIGQPADISRGKSLQTRQVVGRTVGAEPERRARTAVRTRSKVLDDVSRLALRKARVTPRDRFAHASLAGNVHERMLVG